MQGAKPLVSAVVLNYRDPSLTARCVTAFLDSARHKGIPAEAVVVDNSALQTAAELRRLLPPEVMIIENAVNVGFARANNQGIAVSSGEFILLLNNDAFVNGTSLQTGVDFLTSVPNVGIWAPSLRGEDGRLQVSCARLPTLRGLAGEYLLRRNLDWYQDMAGWREPTAVESVVGAFFLIPRPVVAKVGGLDEDYFFTVEDMDYCKRVTDAGFSVYYDPRCSVVHIGGASQGQRRWHADPFLHRFRILYFQKHRGGLAGLCASLIITVGLNLRRLGAWFRSQHRLSSTP